MELILDVCTKKSGGQIYPLLHALIHPFMPGRTYENLQGY